MKGKNGYLSGKPCFGRFKKKKLLHRVGTDFESSLTQNDGQTNCVVSVTYFHEAIQFKTKRQFLVVNPFCISKGFL